MLAPFILDSCDPGIQIQAPERGGHLRDRVAGAEEEVRGAGAVAAPESGDRGAAHGTGEGALAVPVRRGGDDGGRGEMRGEKEVVDMPPGRAVAVKGEPHVPVRPGKPAAPERRPDVDVPAESKLPHPESADTDDAAGVFEDEGVDTFIHRTGAPR